MIIEAKKPNAFLNEKDLKDIIDEITSIEFQPPSRLAKKPKEETKPEEVSLENLRYRLQKTNLEGNK